jgi:hypothetical protein
MFAYGELATPIIGTQHLGQPPHLIVGKHKILAWHKQLAILLNNACSIT